MGPDWRYHLTTLICVLSAVLMGVMIGANLTDPARLEKRDKKLGDEFKRVITQSRQVGEEKARAVQAAADSKEALDEAIKTLLPVVIKGKLTGKRIALVHTSGRKDFAVKDAIVNALQLAGAEVSSVTEIDAKVADDASRLDAVASQLNWVEEANSRVEQLAGALASAFAAGDALSAIPVLARTKVIRIGSDYSKPVHAVVVVGGADQTDSKQAEALDRPLIKALLAQKINVVGCEAEKVALSFMPEYTRLHISTVDNVDAWSGQIALVDTIAGQRGHYGVKSGASSKLPPMNP